MNHQQRMEDLRFQLRSLQQDLRVYEGIGENMENLKRRLDETVDEVKYLKNEKEKKLIEEATKEMFLQRAAKFDTLVQENSLLESQLSGNNQNYEETNRKLRKDNDLLRATVIEQNLHIQHLRDRLALMMDRHRQKFGFAQGSDKF